MNKRKIPLLFKVLVLCQLIIGLAVCSGAFPIISQASEMATDVGLVFEGEEPTNHLPETGTDEPIQDFVDNLIERLPQTGEAILGSQLLLSGLLCMFVAVLFFIMTRRRQKKEGNKW